MSAVETWSTNAANNNAAPPDGFPENQTPASLNNSAREVMAAVATLVRQYPWLRLTSGLTLVRNSNTQFQLTGTDVTSIFRVGRRLREVGATTVYGSVLTSTFSGGNTLVDVTNDAAANIPASLTAVDVAVVDADSVPPTNIVPALATVYIPAAAMAPSTSSGCAGLTQTEVSAFLPELLTLDFDGAGSSIEYALFSFPFPKRWNEGTITAKFHYTVSSAVGTTVKWDLQAVSVADNEAVASSWGTIQSVTDTFHGTANRLAITSATSAITVAGTPAAGEHVFFRVGRDPANDTTSQDARLIGVEINYTIDATTDA